MSETARRYARALYEQFPEVGALEGAFAILTEQRVLWDTLCSPAIRSEEKERILARLPELADQATLRRFFGLLARKGRMALLPEIVTEVRGLDRERRNIGLCRFSWAHRPVPEELEKLRHTLCRIHHRADIQFDIRLCPDLLGGFVLEVDGVTYDKSIRGALDDLGRQLEKRRMA